MELRPSSSSLLFSLLLGLMILDLNLIEASHQLMNVDVQLRDDDFPVDEQLSRTGYHFQPPKNWINVKSKYDFVDFLKNEK
ncbi:hypothetical protein M569_00984 [Genlisea aurea]|uniref:Uncharacterized protein n=1 Tax=Genlisea aurea TaxID=192259 RepID=S8EM68_9LAMI|nr:hypothetical protein M569_00984 [Genlisea aurea]